MSSMYSIGSMNQHADALEMAGYTPKQVQMLSQSGRLRMMRAVLEGRAEIILIKVEEKMVYLKRLFADEVIKFDDVKVVGYQLIKNATFMSMLKDIGEKRRCWEDNDEILRFSRAHKDRLGPNGNFFERKDGFVVYVGLDHVGRPCVDSVYPLSFDYTWSAVYQHRVFSPQQ